MLISMYGFQGHNGINNGGDATRLAIGNGYYLGGLTATIIVLFALVSLGSIEKKVFKSQYKSLIVQCKERSGLIGDIGHILGKYNITIKKINVDSEYDIKQIKII